MKLTLFFVFVGLLQVSANVYSQAQRLSVKLENASIKEVLNEIEEKSAIKFLYKDKSIEDRQVSIDAENRPVDEILDVVLKETGNTYRIMDNNLIIISPGASLQPDLVVKGKVTDSSGLPLPGVSVVVKGTSRGVITSADGIYSLPNIPSDATLVFSFVGMKTQEIAVAGKTNISIQMQEETVGIEEVVAIGYGTQKRSDLTGAVSSVKSEDFNNGLVVSPEQLIQGKMAGVNITGNTGEPGVAQTIIIRGPGSIRSGNGPLFVVDGVPLDNSTINPSAPDVGFGSSNSLNPLNFLNPSDIASMDVLKDASATAIYGSRGANGVIIITTKRGKGQAEGLSYSGSLGVSNVARKIDVLTASEYIDFQRTKGDEDNIYDPGISTDWQDVIFRSAFTQNHNLSLSGNNASSDYFVSLSLMDQQGTIKANNLKRYTGRVNFTQRLLDDRLKVGINLTVGHTDNTGSPRNDTADANYGNLLSDMIGANPTYPTHNTDGSLFVFPNGRNPLADLEIFDDFTRTDRVLGNIESSLEILKGMEYKINFSIDRTVGNRETQISPNSLANMQHPEGRVVFSDTESSSRVIDNYLKYNMDFNRHHIILLAGHSYQHLFYRHTQFSIDDFTTDEIEAYYNPGIASSVNSLPSGGATVNELQSFFSRLNYDFGHKYLLTVTLRADGSSKFGKNNRYGFFPSVAGAWHINEEDFMKNSSLFSELKLRLGWGQTGNQEIPGKITQASLTSSSNTGQGAYPLYENAIIEGYTYTRTANPDIKWEVTTQTNIGLDFAFIRGALSGSIDYFYKNTSDMLLNLTVSDPISPTATVWSNVDMDVMNKGFEMALNYSSGASKPFQWSCGGNATFLHNEVKNTPFTFLPTGYVRGPGQTGVTCSGILNGESISSFYLYKHLGFDENGENLFQGADDEDGLTADDRVVAGSPIPTFTYNLYGNFKYKSFEFSLNFNGVTGNKIYNNTANAYFNVPQLASGLNIAKNMVNQEETLTNSATASTRYLEDGSFFRLNNATLKYNFNLKNFTWSNKLSLFITGQNLFVISKYHGFDPEVNVPSDWGGITAYGIDFANYPKSRTFMVGINVSF